MSAAPHTSVDVLVVGLGPAGAAAADAAACAGRRVLAIERNTQPGLPVQCAEFVPMMIGAELPDLGDTRLQTIARMETFVAGAAPFITRDFRGYMIDRARFDQHLIAQAQAAGAKCRFGTPLLDLAADGTATLGDGSRIKARAIIGADGPRSAVGKTIGAAITEQVLSRQITVDLTTAHDATDIFLHPDIIGGYAWLFPRGAQCNLGLGVLPQHRARLKPLLDDLHAKLAAEGCVSRRVHHHTGGWIPVGGMAGPLGRLANSQVLLCGDAAGLTNPITGAGINTAVVSGRMAGEAAVALLHGDEGAPEDYAEELSDIFGPSLRLACRRRAQILQTYAGGGTPAPHDLRDTWIAYPQYWTKDAAPAASPPAAQQMEAHTL